MPVNITMPALSPTMEEGTLAKWLVKEGDRILSGDVIAEIETDKATMEVESVDEGTVARILVSAGSQGVKVNTVIAVLAGKGEDASATVKSGGDPHEAGKAEAAAQAKSEPAPSLAGNRTFTSPLARRLARDAGVDIESVKGSGPRGRVVKTDIDAAISSASAESEVEAPSAVPASKPLLHDAVLRLLEEGSYGLVRHDSMRKTIARRLVEAKSTIPHFYLELDCELDALLALRKQLNDTAPRIKTEKREQTAYKLSVNDMVVKAMAMALKDVPAANVSWTEANMVQHRHADVGVAISIPGGLITPIVRRADEKSLSTISNEMKDLVTRARDRKLKVEEYQGGTTAVSNLGMFAVRNFSAVINPPRATILAVGAGELRPIVKDGVIEIATVMSVTLSSDHRAVDGALGARLLAAFKCYIEKPMSMLV